MSAGLWQGLVCAGHLGSAAPCWQLGRARVRSVSAELLPVTHRQPPSHTEPPTAPACDPGKLRLMEDAEDWQPRTGTSQSRSFRKLARLTGTDGRCKSLRVWGCMELPAVVG